MHRRLIYALVGIVVIQELRFQHFKGKVKEFMELTTTWIQLEYQEQIDDQFEDIVEESLADLDDLGGEPD